MNDTIVLGTTNGYRCLDRKPFASHLMDQKVTTEQKITKWGRKIIRRSLWFRVNEKVPLNT